MPTQATLTVEKEPQARQEQARKRSNSFAKHDLLLIGAVFLLSFALRAAYNCFWLDHRICHFGDAYNFLRSGSCLLQTIAHARSPLDIANIFFHPAPPSGQILQSMTSMNLTDRLLIDGPVFPSYLALIEWLSGVNPANPIFDNCSTKLTICNSIMDALTCVLVYVCGRFAFNRKTALVAGLIFSIYPAAIINTQHCYSEQFSYFVLTLWTALVLGLALRHTPRPAIRLAGVAMLGIATGMLMLSKPAFVLLPPLVALTIGAIRYREILASLKHKRTIALAYLACLAIGFAGSVTPWLCFNKSTSGNWSLFVNRVPAFNIFHGNQLKTDGWRCYPYRGCFPGESKEVVSAVIRDGLSHPAEFTALQLKKVARLWSGVWNEYHYSLFGIPIEVQSLFHQVLLFLAVLGAPLCLIGRPNWRLSQEFCAGAILSLIVLFHFAYLPFEAISRYAITAMPAISLLAAFALVGRTAAKSRFGFALSTRQYVFAMTGAAVCAFMSLSSQGALASLIASFLPLSLSPLSPWISWSIAVAPLAVLAFFCSQFLRKLVGRWSLAVATPIVAVCAVAAVALAYSVQSNDWKEWYTDLTREQPVARSFELPSNSIHSPISFVLVDLESNVMAPRIAVTVNGIRLQDEPFPLARLMPDNKDILQCLAIQGEGMGRDLRGYRHWWVIPVSTSILKQGDSNQIRLSSLESSDATKVYGDIVPATTASSDGPTNLPSLYSYSYTKGFTTFDHRDCRVFEPVTVEGKTEYCSRTLGLRRPSGVPVFAVSTGNESNEAAVVDNDSSRDLSDLPGEQRGRYRIYLLAPTVTKPRATASSDGATETAAMFFDTPESTFPIVSGKSELTVSGDNPLSFSPVAPISIPSRTDLRFRFSCKLKAAHKPRPVFVGLTFSGSDAFCHQQLWNSQWQPIGITLSQSQWTTTSFSDEIPREVLALKNLQVSVMFSPFQPDYLFLRKKDALKCAMKVTDATLQLLSPLPLPELHDRKWEVF